MCAGGQKEVTWNWSDIACCEPLEVDAGNHTQVLSKSNVLSQSLSLLSSPLCQLFLYLPSSGLHGNHYRTCSSSILWTTWKGGLWKCCPTSEGTAIPNLFCSDCLILEFLTITVRSGGQGGVCSAHPSGSFSSWHLYRYNPGMYT